MILDYLKTITSPMDLGTIKLKMDRRKYKSIAEFNTDVTLMLHNCLTYNEEGSEVSVVSTAFRTICNSKLSTLTRFLKQYVYRKSSGRSIFCSDGICASRTSRACCAETPAWP